MAQAKETVTTLSNYQNNFYRYSHENSCGRSIYTQRTDTKHHTWEKTALKTAVYAPTANTRYLAINLEGYLQNYRQLQTLIEQLHIIRF